MMKLKTTPKQIYQKPQFEAIPYDVEAEILSGSGDNWHDEGDD